MYLLLPFLISMIVTTAVLPLFVRMALRWQFVDLPDARKVHVAPIPRIGGLAMALGVLVSVLMIIPLERQDWTFLAGASVIALGGALDDRFNLDYRVKFSAQAIGALLVVLAGGAQFQAITLEQTLVLPHWAAIAISLLFIIGVTNAINLADGLDGLAGGTTFLSLSALALLAYISGEASCAALSLAFAGAILGFLRFNTYPATVFMGDAGSQLLGFAVGVLSLRATQTDHSVISATTPILLLALPILDTLSVMAQRISEGRSPFSADKNHIHHKLLALGLSHHEAVMAIYVMQADLFLLAYWLRFESDVLILAVVLTCFVACIALLQVAVRHGWRMRAAPAVRFASESVDASSRASAFCHVTVAAALAGYVGLVLIERHALSADVQMLLIALLILAAGWLLLMRSRPLSSLEKGILYISGALVVYLDTGQHTRSWLPVATWVALITVAVGTALRLQLAKDRRFALTSLDLIVLFVALVIPSLSSELGLPEGSVLGVAKLVIVFYGIEVLATRSNLQALWMRLAATSLLCALVFRVVV